MSSSYIAILYRTQGPVFAAVTTINEAQACLGQWMNQQPLRLGEAMAIITADTDQVVYFRNLSRIQTLLDAIAQPWMYCKQLVINYLVFTETV